MVWSNGKIYIVELPGWVYNQAKLFFREAMINSTQTGRKFLFPAGSTYVESMDHIEPTIAFASRPESGAVLPAGLHWAEFHTLKVEIGVSQRWAQLNRKAVQWSHFPGVQYVLCIHISPGRNIRNYRQFSVVNGAFEQPEMQLTDIVDPTPIHFDSHRLLGLPPNAPLPPGFPDPVLTVDLWTIVAEILKIPVV